MSSIAVIDDREDMREAVRDVIDSVVGEFDPPWNVIASRPLKEMSDYPAWIVEHDITVLVLDERLDDVADSNGDRVNYSGHQLARTLRREIADLPQFIVTSVKNEDDLASDDAAAIEALISRKDFNRRYKVYIERMVRAGSAYVERQEHELQELSRISELIVEGGATDADMSTLAAIRAKLANTVSDESLPALKKLVEEADEIKSALKDALRVLGRG